MPNPFSNEQGRFSIITPCYKTAYRTFDKFFSALNESDYHNFEVIISFDGPNARGWRELEKMREKYPEMDIHHVNSEWGGAPHARNKGANMATGDFLTFLDPDVYLYSDTMRFWINSFEESPDKDVVWGLYDILVDNEKKPVGGAIPCDAADQPVYYAFRSSNYCSGAFPIRKSAYVGWDESVKSLQDWDMWQRMLLKDNFEGKKFKFHRRSFFATEPIQEGGISHDSATNWIERTDYVRNKNGIPKSDMVVCSLGAPFHGVNISKMLGVDYLPMPSFKPHEYKTIYLVGFYPTGLEGHLQVFANFKGKKIIHWIGTDIYQLNHTTSVSTLEELKHYFKIDKFIHLSEYQTTHDELRKLGLKSKIVPIPPQKIYEPMPLPKKFIVGIYENPTQNMYAEEQMEHIARSMPDIEFKLFGDETKKGNKFDNVEHLGWVSLDEWMPKLSCNLRMTIHDGLSLTILQFLTAGRTVVTNSKVKGTLYVSNDRKSIVEALRACQSVTTGTKAAKYWINELKLSKFKKRIGAL
jgi:glycosyltransferase involved in cell wall biosynthesis